MRAIEASGNAYSEIKSLCKLNVTLHLCGYEKLWFEYWAKRRNARNLIRNGAESWSAIGHSTSRRGKLNRRGRKQHKKFPAYREGGKWNVRERNHKV